MAASKFLIDTYDYHLRQINLAGFWYMLLTDFQAMFHFYTPPPPPPFSDVFRGYRSGTFVENGLIQKNIRKANYRRIRKKSLLYMLHVLIYRCFQKFRIPRLLRKDFFGFWENQEFKFMGKNLEFDCENS